MVKWSNLENQLLSVCPSCSVPYYFYPQTTCSSSPAVYLLKFLCSDRNGLLHGNENFSHFHFMKRKSILVQFPACGSLISCFLNSFVLDVTKILSELELAIQRVKVTTTPDDRVLDLFFITDNMWVLLWYSYCFLYVKAKFSHFGQSKIGHSCFICLLF